MVDGTEHNEHGMSMAQGIDGVLGGRWVSVELNGQAFRWLVLGRECCMK